MAAREIGFYVVVWVSLRVCFFIFSVTSFADRTIRAQHQKYLLTDVLHEDDSPHATGILLLYFLTLSVNYVELVSLTFCKIKPKIYSLLL